MNSWFANRLWNPEVRTSQKGLLALPSTYISLPLKSMSKITFPALLTFLWKYSGIGTCKVSLARAKCAQSTLNNWKLQYQWVMGADCLLSLSENLQVQAMNQGYHNSWATAKVLAMWHHRGPELTTVGLEILAQIPSFSSHLIGNPYLNAQTTGPRAKPTCFHVDGPASSSSSFLSINDTSSC